MILVLLDLETIEVVKKYLQRIKLSLILKNLKLSIWIQSFRYDHFSFFLIISSLSLHAICISVISTVQLQISSSTLWENNLTRFKETAIVASIKMVF